MINETVAINVLMFINIYELTFRPLRRGNMAP